MYFIKAAAKHSGAVCICSLSLVVSTEGYTAVTAQYKMQIVNIRKVMRG